MATRKRWTQWTLDLPTIAPHRVERGEDGYLRVMDGRKIVLTLTPLEARWLYTKLAGDYRD